LTFITCPALPREFNPVPPLTNGKVPAVIEDVLIAATLNVPKATASTTSPFANADAKTILFPEDTVTSVPLTCLTPFR
jgi:hypothetical protein